MNRYETHVFATVRVKVAGTNFSNDPQAIADAVSNAVCAAPSQWMRAVEGVIDVDGHGQHDIVQVEFADAISGVVVDELGERDALVQQHHFDANCRPTDEQLTRDQWLEDAYRTLLDHPEASVGNSKVHWVLMRLKSLVAAAPAGDGIASRPYDLQTAPDNSDDGEDDDDAEERALRAEAIAFLKSYGYEANINGYFSIPHWHGNESCSRKVFDDALDAAAFLKEELPKWEA